MPLSLNRYSYALNNPVNRTDPSGLSSNRVTNDHQQLSLCWDPTGQLQTNCPGPGQVNCFFDCGEEGTTAYRVQGGLSKDRFLIGENGTLSITGLTCSS